MRQGRRYKHSKLYTWDHDIAYFTGLVAADGCLSNDGRHINITSNDIDLLEALRILLALSCPIGTKRNGFGGYGHFIQFSNVALYDFLQECGLTPAKSKTIGMLAVPKAFYPDFLRGYFDGDGTVYGYWDKRWKNSLMYYCEFTGASLPYLEWIQGMNRKLLGTSPGKIKPAPRTFKLSYAKTDSQKLFLAMYHSNNITTLSRKMVKFVDFLRSDPYANKALLARVLESVDRPA